MVREAKSEILDATLHALADPTRRAILRRLARGEARVTDLAAPFAISLNSVSKHIQILERARLVERRKIGRQHLLKFRPQPLREIQTWISKQQAFWQASLEAIDALLGQEQTAKEQSR